MSASWRDVQGPIHCAATIVREEGPRGLWSGASPTVLRNGTNQMCLFWAKNHMDGAELACGPVAACHWPEAHEGQRGRRS